MRDAPVRHRNVRHQTTNKKGRERFSALVSFNHTCELNGAWPSRAVREMCLDPPRNMFSRVPDRGAGLERLRDVAAALRSGLRCLPTG